VGDSDLGKDINLGCGVVFVNYDGKEKHRTSVGDGAFIGCNVNIVSPVEVGAGSYVAAGTTLTHDLPDGALAVGRAKQRVIEGWVKKRGLIKQR
jgi:bifunctional UDP-N-acetylglucosamine pyrophosphorylase/glucosamine-1-phosphate N-acetyltransferase